MTAFEVYQTYLALKAHFTRDSYNFHKYSGKVNASVRTFEGRRDRFYFDKLARLKDPTSFILANIIHNKDIWVGDLLNEQSEQRYRDWLKRQQSLSYNFRSELRLLEGNFDDNFRVEAGRHPRLIKEYLAGRVGLETLVILAHLANCFAYWNKALRDDPIWKEVARKMIKYQPFMKYDIKKFKSIVLEEFS